MKNKNPYALGKLISGLLIVASVIVAIVGLTNQNEDYTMLIIGIVAILITSGVYKGVVDKSRAFCDACGSSLSGCAYEYEEVRRSYNASGTALTVVVEISSECPECGAIKTFRQSFKVTNGSNNLQYQVDCWCKNHFGH